MWSAITGWPKILPGGVKKSKKLKFAEKLDEFNSTFGSPKKIFTYHYKVLRYFFKFQVSIYALKKIFVQKKIVERSLILTTKLLFFMFFLTFSLKQIT